MQSRNDIGFGKKVRARWLETALRQAADGMSFDEAKGILAKDISVDNPGAEAVRKILTCLKRVWFAPRDYCRSLRDAGLDLVRRDDSSDCKFVLNWGMAIAAYPFMGDVAETLGRLLKLQGEARRADVDRRVREQRGDRGFVHRITRINVSSLLDWQAIAEGERSGVYIQGKQVRLRLPEQVGWLCEAVLISWGRSQMDFSQLCHHPALFPIVVEPCSASVLRGNPRLRVMRQSVNHEVVGLDGDRISA